MKISCIMLVTQVDLAKELIKDIKNNSTCPSELIIIDNSKIGISPEEIGYIFSGTCCDLKYERNAPPRPLNASWMQSFNMVSKDAELVTVLNDDLIMNTRFFFELNRLMSVIPERYVVACPNTVEDKNEVFKEICTRKNEYEIMRKREGWAFTMRKYFMDMVVKEPIPEILKTFCGDDWIWLHSSQRKLEWVKMPQNYIYHYVGKTIKNNGTRPDLNNEKRLFLELTNNKQNTPNFIGIHIDKRI